MSILIITLTAGLAWWAQGRHDAANTGHIYGHGNITQDNLHVSYLDLELPIESRYGPTVGDVDGDGQNEILVVAGAYSGENLLCSLSYRGPQNLYLENSYQFSGDYTKVDCAPALCDVGRGSGSPGGGPDSFPDVIWHHGTEGVVEAVDFYHTLPDPLPIWSWHNNTMDPTSPTVADFNGDGVHDVVIGDWNGKAYLLNGHGFPRLLAEQNVNDSILSKPAVGDIDNDGDPEVVVVDKKGDVWVWDDPMGANTLTKILDYEAAGVRAGWACPVLCNLDNDPDLEIVVYLTYDSNQAQVIGLQDNGTVLWTTTIPSHGFPSEKHYTAGFPAVCDLNGDGTVDVVVAANDNSYGGTVYALNGKTGTVLPGFPVQGLQTIDASPAIADVHDVDRDPRTYDPEIVAVGAYGQLYILSASGGILVSYDLPYDGSDDDYISAAPTIADCDDDGVLEITVCRGKELSIGRVYVVDGSSLPEKAWQEVPGTNYFPPPQPDWRARFFDASTMPPDRAVDRGMGIDPNLVSDTVVAVGELGIAFNGLPLPVFSYYSTDRGNTWHHSIVVDICL